MGNSEQLLQQTAGSLKQTEDAIASLGDNSVEMLGIVSANLAATQEGLDTVTVNVKNVRDGVESWLEGYSVELPAQTFDNTAATLEYYGYVPFGEGVADYLESTDGAIDLWPLNLTAGDFNAVADGMEAVRFNGQNSIAPSVLSK